MVLTQGATSYLYINNMFKRICNSCNVDIFYKNRNTMLRANIENSLCKKCSQHNRFENSESRNKELWTIKCSCCQKERKYKSYKSFKNAQFKKIKLCRRCAYDLMIANDPNLKLNTRNKLLNISFSGKRNGFFGKSHSIETKLLLSEKGKENPSKGMTGKTVYSVWLEKYGKDVADEKAKSWKETQRKNSSGKNNPMYGKPAPNGSGNGWSGWYKNWFFRSINELSYMVNVIERFNIMWETGESKKFKISYTDWDGSERNYFPDFILNNKYIVECKPKKLWNTPRVSSKRKGAEIFCDNNKLKYKLVECRKLTYDDVKNLYDSKIITLTKRYEKKLLEKYITIC